MFSCLAGMHLSLCVLSSLIGGHRLYRALPNTLQRNLESGIGGLDSLLLWIAPGVVIDDLLRIAGNSPAKIALSISIRPT